MLYVTVEPCLMCMGAIIAADITAIVWGVNDRYGGAARFVLERYEKENMKKVLAIPEPRVKNTKEIGELMK